PSVHHETTYLAWKKFWILIFKRYSCFKYFLAPAKHKRTAERGGIGGQIHGNSSFHVQICAPIAVSQYTLVVDMNLGSRLLKCQKNISID
ncbi:MAG: hypothetical protein EZS28_031149, partial [Streblomastix strix]